VSNYIKRVRASGLFYQKTDLVVDFTELTNCIFGVNGTGKTVLINLIVNTLRVNISELLKTPFASLTLLSSERGKKNAENFLTISKEDNKIIYVFHSNFQVGVDTTWHKLSSSSQIKITKNVEYYVESPNHGLTYYYKDNEIKNKKRKSISFSALSKVIDEHISLTYIPLLRHSNSIRSVDSAYFNEQDIHFEYMDPNISVLRDLEGELSEKFASAQVEVSKILEDLSSKFFEKLLLSSTHNVGPSNSVAQINKILKRNTVEYDEEKVKKVASIITDLDLQIPKKRIYEHYQLWKDMQERLLFAHNNAFFDKEDKEDKEIATRAYHEAYFNLLAYIPMYGEFEAAIEEIKHAHYKKQLLLNPFERLEAEVNGFLSKQKCFEFNNSGRFHFKNRERSFDYSILSSGEKHMIAILGRVCVSSFDDTSTFIADEPELSLHLEWQREILPAVRRLSPNTQIIVATHSPAVISGQSNLIDIEECYKNG